jgi:hypothetical protein
MINKVDTNKELIYIGYNARRLHLLFQPKIASLEHYSHLIRESVKLLGYRLHESPVKRKTPEGVAKILLDYDYEHIKKYFRVSLTIDNRDTKLASIYDHSHSGRLDVYLVSTDYLFVPNTLQGSTAIQLTLE